MLVVPRFLFAIDFLLLKTQHQSHTFFDDALMTPKVGTDLTFQQTTLSKSWTLFVILWSTPV